MVEIRPLQKSCFSQSFKSVDLEETSTNLSVKMLLFCLISNGVYLFSKHDRGQFFRWMRIGISLIHFTDVKMFILHNFIVLSCDQKQKPSDYARLTATSHPVMIISYEMLMRCHDDVKSINFQLLICDEGHRLKNNQNRISMLLSQLEIERKILLSGTPVQNNLQEFFALIDFVNPGTVGTYTGCQICIHN